MKQKMPNLIEVILREANFNIVFSRQMWDKEHHSILVVPGFSSTVKVTSKMTHFSSVRSADLEDLRRRPRRDAFSRITRHLVEQIKRFANCRRVPSRSTG